MEQVFNRSFKLYAEIHDLSFSLWQQLKFHRWLLKLQEPFRNDLASRSYGKHEMVGDSPHSSCTHGDGENDLMLQSFC